MSKGGSLNKITEMQARTFRNKSRRKWPKNESKNMGPTKISSHRKQHVNIPTFQLGENALLIFGYRLSINSISKIVLWRIILPTIRLRHKPKNQERDNPCNVI